jgi:hypothetical protein
VRVERIFWVEILGRPVQRRGVRVNTPEIGSRDGEFSFGGILDIYAELRRDLNWRNLKVGFFGVLVEVPRGGWEEGGPTVCTLGNLGELIVCLGTLLLRLEARGLI